MVETRQPGDDQRKIPVRSHLARQPFRPALRRHAIDARKGLRSGLAPNQPPYQT